MSKETESDYAWAVDHVAKIFSQQNPPAVILTDRELALMSAIRTQFLDSTNLICIWHINKNITAKTRKFFPLADVSIRFEKDWQLLIASQDVATYEANWEKIKTQYPEAVCDYISDIWLPLKERFVKAWTNCVQHLGNTATSRAEGKHGAVKSWIAVSSCDLADVCHRIQLSIDHQEAVVRRAIAFDQTHTLLEQHGHIWAAVTRKISQFALKLVHEQLRKAQHFGDIVAACTGTFNQTLGLPCAHRIRTILSINGQFQLSDFAEHWWLQKPNTYENASNNPRIENAIEQYEARHIALPPHQQRVLEERLIALSQETTVEPVQEPVPIRRGRGRPPGSRNRVNTSTRRDPSSFERVEAEYQQ